jgi:multisubunit Na+/H+ antiporter MnhC subunit
MPKTLHADLARRSDAEGVSLNQFIVTALARAVSGADPASPTTSGEAPRAFPRSVRNALVVNAFVVAFATVTAVVLLVVGWR